jgi:hypothetical protein
MFWHMERDPACLRKSLNHAAGAPGHLSGPDARLGTTAGIVRRVAEPELTIADRPDANRYEARLGDMLAGFVDYRLVRRRRILIHTEVPTAFGGRGIGAALARHVLEDARATGIQVTVKCPFIGAYLRRHPEYADVVAPALGPRSQGG